ncbi:MAG: PD-(D/E)XK nuclease family protein [Lachnospiraceae bacterium]|jgi:hypothetical protein|nr:PD-(D/E)XK nuclease family protein [Lachnospiraceae bacterium]
MASDELKQLEKELSRIKFKELPNTFLNIIGRNSDEVVISKILAFLLNPRNTSVKILQGVIDQYHGETPELEIENYEDEKTTEIVLDNGRIDLLFKFTNCWIAIENKINSLENGDQTERYVRDLEKENKEGVPIVYIYLKPRYNKSVPKSDKFKVVTYDILINIFKSCSIYDFKYKENYVFMDDIIRHVEGYLMANEELELGEEIDFYVKHKEKIKSIEENYKTQCVIAINKLVRKLKSLQGFNIYPTNATKNTYGTNKFIQIYKDNWLNNRHKGIHYEILFGDSAIIGKKTKTTIKLDVENDASNYEDSLNNIVNNTKDTEEMDFSTGDAIINSIEEIVKKIKDTDEKYTKEIDKILM